MCFSMTQEWMLKTLLDLGFKKQDAEVYVLLVMNGPKSARDIADVLGTYKRKVYRIIKNLQNMKVANATSTVPAEFSAISFDKVLDMLIKANIEEANRMEQKKDKMFSLWKRNVTKSQAT
jgi:sugar-specific transcriptional regulator TrmB